MNKRYNIRVYGIIENQLGEILVADEFRFGRAFTKFPGGGLEWGEGLKDGLKRELMEELGLEATIGDLFYVNDFFQPSAFRNDDQLISFYFRVDEIDTTIIERSRHTVPLTEEGEAFRWISRDELNEETFTFPLDKIVSRKLSY